MIKLFLSEGAGRSASIEVEDLARVIFMGKKQTINLVYGVYRNYGLEEIKAFSLSVEARFMIQKTLFCLYDELFSQCIYKN